VTGRCAHNAQRITHNVRAGPMTFPTR
jgi:hypothetical protein